MKRIFIAIAVVLGFVSIPVTSFDVRRADAADPVESPSGGDYPDGAVYLDQGWDADTAQWWYFVSQGTRFMPYPFFLALEQADGTEFFRAPEHMRRLGFLVDPPHPEYNPDGLPVGFAKRQPIEGDGCWKGDWVGFGCAACHTGQVNHRGRQIRIEGGAAHNDIEAFQRALGGAINALALDEEKRERFVKRVLASGVASLSEVGTALQCLAQNAQKSRTFLEAAQAAASERPTPSGFGRLDAHERGVNFFLGSSIQETANYVPETAPVSFPALWDTPYFDWVLYNTSIRQPLARNVIEALGVQAPIDHTTIVKERLIHGVDMDNIAKGQKEAMDLMSPLWPEDILGAIDETKAARGKVLYGELCVDCHIVIDRNAHAPEGAAKGAELEIPTFPLDKIGTDPRQATTFAERMVNLSKIGGPASIESHKAAELAAGKIVDQWIAESPENAKLAEEINQGRPNEFRGILEYRARSLNGIWSTAPYLHNGTVASLHQLLQPASRRSKVLYMGNWEFDPVRVGIEAGSPFPGATVLDTSLPGNSNAGHEFGTDLGDADRAALIEYLKSL